MNESMAGNWMHLRAHGNWTDCEKNVKMSFNTFVSPIFHRSDAQLREIRETMFMQMAPALCTQITAQLSQVLLAEIQKSLYPIVSTKLDAMKAQVQSEIAQKMTVTDRIVKENIANMCRSKVISILDVCDRCRV